MIRTLKERLPKSFLTYFLICVFGVGSWVAINGMWAEISVLVNVSPECQKLPALLVVIIQLANVGPLLYGAIKYCFHRCKWKSHEKYLEIGAISMLLVIGILSCILLSLFWNKTALIFNCIHSVSLLILAFFLAVVDCTSSVVFIPFMKHFPAEYMSALYIGEGLSGILPSVVALSQGFVKENISCSGNYTGHELLGIRFSPNIYFTFLAGMMILCGAAFLSIVLLPAVRKHMITNRFTESNISSNRLTESKKDQEIHKQCEDGKENENEQSQHSPSVNESDVSTLLNGSHSQCNGIKSYKEQTNLEVYQFSLGNICKLIYLNSVVYACLFILSFLGNGSLSAISSFALFPYGNEVYHTAINLALLANPLACLLYTIIPSKSKVISVMMTGITCLLGIYILVTALMSPEPFLHTHQFGKVLIVSCHISLPPLCLTYLIII